MKSKLTKPQIKALCNIVQRGGVDRWIGYDARPAEALVRRGFLEVTYTKNQRGWYAKYRVSPEARMLIEIVNGGGKLPAT